jgi:glycosyltransferase involved in cell wall biosynthesis
MVPTDTWGVGSYRCLLPGRELAARGHEVFVHGDPERPWAPDGDRNVPLASSLGFTADGGVEESFDADVYVFQQRFEFWVPSAIRLLRRAGKVVVGETCDLYDGLDPGSPAAKTLAKFSGVWSVAAMNEGFAFSNAVTVSTPALAEHYGRYNRDVRVLPAYLDWGMWESVELQCEVERPRIRVGWMGWLPTRGRDMDVLRGWLPAWLQRHPNVEFVSIGERPGEQRVHTHLSVPKWQRATVEGVPFHRLAEIVPTVDIGLVPLEFNEFNECKSWLKGLEYAACGIPCVATPTEQYRDFVHPGDNGLLATTPEDWMAALDLLVSDEELRRSMGRAARRKAETMTLQNHAGLWESTYQSLLAA